MPSNGESPARTSRKYRGDQNQVWRCEEDDIDVRVLSSDPFYPNEVICPECKCPMELQS